MLAGLLAVSQLAHAPATVAATAAPSIIVARGRGADDLPAVRRVARLRTAESSPRTTNKTPSSRPKGGRSVTATNTSGVECLSGDSTLTQGCVVAQLEPQLTAPSACAGLDGTFNVQVGSTNPASLVSYAYPYVSSGSDVPTTFVTDGIGGQTYTWVFEPSSTNTSCYDATAPVWRTFRIDMLRQGVEPGDTVGPVGVKLASGAMTTGVASSAVSMVGGSVAIGLSYRSPGGVGYQIDEPTNTLPGGWSLDGLGGLPPWVTLTQVGTGTIPAAVVLEAIDGTQIEFTNTLAGTSSTTGSWAPPTQEGWPAGQFGTLVGSADLAAADSTFTWSSGQEVVVFAKTGTGAWGVQSSYGVESGGYQSAGVTSTWASGVSPPRLTALADPVSGKTATFAYGDGSTCNGATPPTDGSDVYLAPSGLLCGWTSFDDTSTSVWYSEVATDSYQVGWVVRPGNANTQYFWASDGGLSYPELVGVQDPLGNDAQSSVPSLTEEDTTWTINYDAFGNVASVVSPLPGVSSFVPSASDQRKGRVYTYNTDSSGFQWATIARAALADNDTPTVVTAGATIVEELAYDGAWRPLLSAITSSTGAVWEVQVAWDTTHDRQLAIETPDGRMTANVFDYLGRATDNWGPAPATQFEYNSSGTGVVPAAGYGDDNIMHTTATFDADADNKLTGFTANFFTGSTPTGVPASTVGSCSDGQCTGSVGPVSWTTLPSGANVSGGDWSMQLTASREAPVDAGTTAPLQYRLSTDGNGSATLWANGSCAISTSPSSCATSNTAAPPSGTAEGEPVTLSVQYVRSGASVSSGTPTTVTVEESTDGGSSWAALTSTDIDPGFQLPSATTQNDTLSAGGGTTTLTSTSSYSDPEFGQVGSSTVAGGSGATLTTQSTWEPYDGATQWGRMLTGTRAGGSQVAAAYWGSTDTVSDPCDGSTGSINQAGLQKTFTGTAGATGTASGEASSMVYDVNGRPLSQARTSADGTSTQDLCMSYDDRGYQVAANTSDDTLQAASSLPWDDPSSADPFTVDATFVAPNTAGASTTYTASGTIDLLGRRVQAVDQWGTTTTINHAEDTTSGVTTTTSTTTTSGTSPYTVTDIVVTNGDGTIDERTRTDSSGTTTLNYSYNADSTVATIELVGPSNTEIVTESFSYDATTGLRSGATWTKAGAVVASESLTFAPNATRLLADSLVVGSTTYDWSYTYNGTSWLAGAELTSSDSSISGTWAYTFDQDGSAASGENPDAYLNGNITQKQTTLNGGAPTTVDYHYDYNDQLTRTSDALIGGNLAYDSWGNMTTVGADTISYNSRNAPIRATDGTNTVAYTRLLGNQVIEKATTTASGTTTIRYSTNGLILDSNNNPLSQQVPFGPVTASFAISSGSTTYQINTIVGRRLVTLDSTGTATSTTATLFDPYGTQIQPSPATAPSTTTPEYAWQGAPQRETEDLGLPFVMMGARIYLPSLGLFSSHDPQPGGGLTLYNYANSDPINYNDPDGNRSRSFWHHDIPKAWDWAFDDKGDTGMKILHGLAGAVVILVVIIVVMVVIASIAYGGYLVYAAYGASAAPTAPVVLEAAADGGAADTEADADVVVDREVSQAVVREPDADMWYDRPGGEVDTEPESGPSPSERDNAQRELWQERKNAAQQALIDQGLDPRNYWASINDQTMSLNPWPPLQ